MLYTEKKYKEKKWHDSMKSYNIITTMTIVSRHENINCIISQDLRRCWLPVYTAFPCVIYRTALTSLCQLTIYSYLFTRWQCCCSVLITWNLSITTSAAESTSIWNFIWHVWPFDLSGRKLGISYTGKGMFTKVEVSMALRSGFMGSSVTDERTHAWDGRQHSMIHSSSRSES